MQTIHYNAIYTYKQYKYIRESNINCSEGIKKQNQNQPKKKRKERLFYK